MSTGSYGGYSHGTLRNRTEPDVKYSRTTTQHQYTCQYHLKGDRAA